jgi:hypothetical protein
VRRTTGLSQLSNMETEATETLIKLASRVAVVSGMNFESLLVGQFTMQTHYPSMIRANPLETAGAVFSEFCQAQAHLLISQDPISGLC